MVCSKCSDCDGNSSSQASAEATDFSQSLPRLSISSPIGSNILHLTALDADLNMPADENFSYYSTHDFHNNNDIAQCFQNGQTFSGKFNIRFQGPKIWNAIDYDIKHLPISSFKIKLKQSFLQSC